MAIQTDYLADAEGNTILFCKIDIRSVNVVISGET